MTTTLPLRGALALLILSHHLGQRTDIYPISYFTAGIGAHIVAIFFFISGYGLCVSYITKGEGYFHGFLRKRLGKLLPKFIVLTLGMMLLYHFFGTSSLALQTKNLMFGGITPLPHSWFIYAIVYTYVSFYLCSLITTEVKKLGILFTISILVYIIVAADFLHYPSYWYITIICVNIGYFTAFYEKRITKFIDNNKILSYSLIVVSIVISYILIKIIGGIAFSIWMSTQAFAVYIIIRTLKFFQWKWLCKIGKYSLDIYLIHGIPLKMGQYIGLENWSLWLFTYAVSIPCAIILNYIFDVFSRSKIFYKLNITKVN
ncbi:MAG: acyltransferase [Muribaculaceae bacterium]|nr:acyltransferase [Muribaculaceae bacterium]